MSATVTITGLDLAFGARPRVTFAALDGGASRREVQESTRQVVAVHGVDLSVRAGELLVVMGLSGSGKSSLLRCINGLNGRGGGGGRGSGGAARGSVRVNAPGGAPLDVLRCGRRELRALRMH